jgi:NAD(P)-dependent dehydrogenase (short-subunit alcohol dehydrogenase family)
MTNVFDLSNKVALVAGGAGYLGREVCAGMAAMGARVVVADVRRDATDAVVDSLSAKGHQVWGLELDVGEEPSVVSAVAAVTDKHGRLDVLVNLTTSVSNASLETGTIDDWQTSLRITLSGAYALSREAGRVMVAQKSGSIIHFASMYGLVSPDPRVYGGLLKPNPPAYGAAKAGIIQLVKYEAVMWAPHNVRVNGVAPGPFPNPAGDYGQTNFIPRLAERVPMGRIGLSPEVVGPVLFLASDAASYVTGITIPVDGGWTAW